MEIRISEYGGPLQRIAKPCTPHLNIPLLSLLLLPLSLDFNRSKKEEATMTSVPEAYMNQVGVPSPISIFFLHLSDKSPLRVVDGSRGSSIC